MILVNWAPSNQRTVRQPAINAMKGNSRMRPGRPPVSNVRLEVTAANEVLQNVLHALLVLSRRIVWLTCAMIVTREQR